MGRGEDVPDEIVATLTRSGFPEIAPSGNSCRPRLVPGTGTGQRYGTPVSEASPDTEARRIATEARDRARFEEEALALADQVYRVARRLVGSREEAEDLVQETYARAFRSWKSFTPGTNLRAWLLRILTNLNVDRGRKIQRTPADSAARGDGLLPRQQARYGRRRGGARDRTRSSSASHRIPS